MTFASSRIKNFRAAFSFSDEALLVAIEAYSHVARKLGYNPPAASAAALEQLKRIPDSKKLQVANFLTKSARWAQGELGEDVFSIEKDMLQTALNEYGLEADERLLATIDKETVVEIYSTDMTQLFRSYKMLQMTGYSLLDLGVYEWYVLWERPQLTIQQMQQQIADVIANNTSFKDFEVSPHILKETLKTGRTEPFVPRSCEVRFQKIGMLKRLRDDSPEAFICTAKGSVLATGEDETRQLAFL